jgi:hypothetical protein
MVTNRDFDLSKPELAGPIEELNRIVASLGIEPPAQDRTANAVYGQNVFGIRFSGATCLAIGVDAVSAAFWPTDTEAISLATRSSRDYLLVCANYPDLSRTDALQYFTTFKPGASPWIQDEEEGSDLREIAGRAVNIDSSAKLKDTKRGSDLPPNYNGPENAYAMNLFWLTQIMGYTKAIVEVNRVMKMSLGKSGLELEEIFGAEPRLIDGDAYSRFVINPSSGANSPLVDAVKQIPPNTFHLTDDGLLIQDHNLVSI